MTILQWNLLKAIAKVVLARAIYGAVDQKYIRELEDAMAALNI